MDNSLDVLILTCASERWQKVAKVVAQVADRANSAANLNAIAVRIRTLVDDGKLESKGDLSRWGYSEVRLTQSR